MNETHATAAVVAPSRRLARKQHSALAWFPLLALGLVFGASALGRLRSERTDPLALDAPALPDPRSRCQAPADVAGPRAIAAERAAADKVARYPFVPAEGLRAIGLFSEAENCATAARDETTAARARARRQAFQQRLLGEYRDRLTRYRRARISARPAQALAQVVFLLEFLSAHERPFSAQLRRVRLELEAELTGKEQA
jgi:hypothetical protein